MGGAYRRPSGCWCRCSRRRKAPRPRGASPAGRDAAPQPHARTCPPQPFSSELGSTEVLMRWRLVVVVVVVMVCVEAASGGQGGSRISRGSPELALHLLRRLRPGRLPKLFHPAAAAVEHREGANLPPTARSFDSELGSWGFGGWRTRWDCSSGRPKEHCLELMESVRKHSSCVTAGWPLPTVAQ